MARRMIHSEKLKHWQKIFGEVARWCAKHREPGEKQYECVARVLREYKRTGKLPF